MSQQALVSPENPQATRLVLRQLPMFYTRRLRAGVSKTNGSNEMHRAQSAISHPCNLVTLPVLRQILVD
jgi:hypothetical protein